MKFIKIFTILVIILVGVYYFTSTPQDKNILDNNPIVIGEDNYESDDELDETTKCLPTQRDVDVCIALYQPVCGIVNVQCITTPCNPTQETFSNSCVACSNSLVSEYVEGECSVQ